MWLGYLYLLWDDLLLFFLWNNCRRHYLVQLRWLHNRWSLGKSMSLSRRYHWDLCNVDSLRLCHRYHWHVGNILSLRSRNHHFWHVRRRGPIWFKRLLLKMTWNHGYRSQRFNWFHDLINAHLLHFLIPFMPINTLFNAPGIFFIGDVVDLLSYEIL